MDNSGPGGVFFTGQSGGFLDLQSSIHRHQQTQFGHVSNTHHHNVQPSMNMVMGVEYEQSIGLMEPKGSIPKGISTSQGKGKAGSFVNTQSNSNNMSEDEEPSFLEDGHGENSNGAKGKKGSPWQRMKWTDDVVRLLIQVVAYVGEDGNLEGMEGLKRKSGILQKKGKWKTVSKIMIAKGCHVSPQQCEDKFNDLNKRYKKLNDILGRGTSCRVVENPALMDTMPQLTSKMKEEVKKILCSKHLFYKEMCAYHNGQRIPNCSDLDLQIQSLPLEQCTKDSNDSDGEEAEENDSDESDDADGNNTGGNDEMMEDNVGRKKFKEDQNFWLQSAAPENFQSEIAEFFQDSTKSQWEQREWIKRRLLQLQEERLGLEAEALELEKQRFKWQRFYSKKNRELEMAALESERLMLENQWMALKIKQKEQELDLKRYETSFDNPPFGIDKQQAREQIDLDGRL